MILTRRESLAALAAWSGLSLRAADRKPSVLISSNQYPWLTFYRREGRDWNRDPDAALADFAAAGLTAFEPLTQSAQQIEAYAPLLKKHQLAMPSLYVGSRLHDKEATDSLRRVLAIADAARKLGTRIIVTNPDPLPQGDGKTDAQLEQQAAHLDRLGAELRQRGLTLAYHNHDVEMRHSAREFHHMMLATDPKNVALCLDAHWVYRGSGNSQTALFDVVKLYGSRVVELHLRQSSDGVWTEVFGPGDIDYVKLAARLKEQGVKPLVVLEQAVEAKTAQTLKAVEAHARSRRYAAEVFQAFL